MDEDGDLLALRTAQEVQEAIAAQLCLGRTTALLTLMEEATAPAASKAERMQARKQARQAQREAAGWVPKWARGEDLKPQECSGSGAWEERQKAWQARKEARQAQRQAQREAAGWVPKWARQSSQTAQERSGSTEAAQEGPAGGATGADA